MSATRKSTGSDTVRTRVSDKEIEEIARRTAADISGAPASAGLASSRGPAEAGVPYEAGAQGIFSNVEDAVRAAKEAQPRFVALKLEHRARIIAAIRKAMLENCEALAKAAWEETGLGRYEDKIVKNRLVTEKTPGLEDLAPIAQSGDHGLVLIEPAPFGVIGAITPVTNPTSTIICNSIGMLSAGNAVAFNVHPYAKNCCMQTIALRSEEQTSELQSHSFISYAVF